MAHAHHQAWDFGDHLPSSIRETGFEPATTRYPRPVFYQIELLPAAFN